MTRLWTLDTEIIQHRPPVFRAIHRRCSQKYSCNWTHLPLCDDPRPHPSRRIIVIWRAFKESSQCQFTWNRSRLHQYFTYSFGGYMSNSRPKCTSLWLISRSSVDVDFFLLLICASISSCSSFFSLLCQDNGLCGTTMLFWTSRPRTKGFNVQLSLAFSPSC